jgi:hypothetical protein
VRSELIPGQSRQRVGLERRFVRLALTLATMPVYILASLLPKEYIAPWWYRETE